MRSRHWLSLLGVLAFAQAHADSQPVTSGAGVDYQPAVIAADDGALLVAFERLDSSTLAGDLWLTRSLDQGDTWSAPAAIIATAANERHPALLQRPDDSFVLFYLKNGAGGFRIYRATSADGNAFAEQGALDLGWPTGGEINPHVVQHADGTLTMSYQRLTGSSYVARSANGGVSWDTLRTTIAADGVLPRIVFRESDQRWFATYQVNPGNGQLRLYAKTTSDMLDWSAARVALAEDGDNHDSLPIVMPDDALVVFYIHANGVQYDIWSRRAPALLDFEPALAQEISPDASDVEPHPLIQGAGSVSLYWGRESPVGSLDFDIRRTLRPVLDAVFADGCED